MSASPQLQYRCATHKSTLENSRNLVVFIDGTSNELGPKETNVVKLFEAIPVDGQAKGYWEGIGAGKSIYSSLLEVAFARNVEKNVKSAYAWLVDKYQDGDRIYLFGFSRGAYQVRALAGMIHEVGLVIEKTEERVDEAYRYYLSIDPKNQKTNESVVKFKKAFCYKGVRIHFIGVWDTVSSLGLIKQDVHITASASVTNACHFRHALALDERRVKFMPEYFLEMNAHHGDIQTPRMAASNATADSNAPAVSDAPVVSESPVASEAPAARDAKTHANNVKEVWFAGCHGDVGGISRPHSKPHPNPMGEDHYPVHAGNIPLLWMSREAADEGLLFEPEKFPWWPEDVGLGRMESMNSLWGFFERVPVRHQVSFSGTGKHERRMHKSCPRVVLPGQQIHLSVLPSDIYTPHATLTSGVEIPTVQHKGSGEERPTDEDMANLLTQLLSDHKKTLQSLGEVSLLIDLMLDNIQTGRIDTPAWLNGSVDELSSFDLDKFALVVIHNVICRKLRRGGTSTVADSPAPRELPQSVAKSLREILSSPDLPDFPRALYILRFSAKHQALRWSPTGPNGVINAVMLALDRIHRSRNKDAFPLVMESLCYLIDNEQHRNDVIDELSTDAPGAGKTRLLLALDEKESNHLTASLKMIASVAQHKPDRCEGLKRRVTNLAKNGGAVGLAAEGVLEILEKDHYIIQPSNILGYLANTLPRLDAEIGDASSLPKNVDLPRVLKESDSGSLDKKTMDKLVLIIRSRNDSQRTTATLTLLKLCNNRDIRSYCFRKILEILMKQMKSKETSLLAAYALKTCLSHEDTWTVNDYRDAAQLVVDMVNKGWFDDAVGKVEGAKIFEGLMESDKLRQEIVERDIATKLLKKLEIGNHHETRMSLICLEILWKKNPADLKKTVSESLLLLDKEDINERKKGVKTLSSLAQTKAGELAIKDQVHEIIKRLLPSNGAPSRHQLFSASAVLYNLCKNETLRKEIGNSKGYKSFVARRNSTFYPQT